MGRYYSMSLVWDYKCRFIFHDWYSQSAGTFAMGCVVTFLMAVLTMALPAIRKQARKILFQRTEPQSTSDFEVIDEQQSYDMSKSEAKASARVLGVLYWLIHSLLQVAVMLLVMSMNGYVALCVICGFTLGFVLFDQGGRLKPARCSRSCHNSDREY